MSTDMERVHSAPAPTWVSQGTAIEQARATAEVQAAIFLAHQFPRSLHVARKELSITCDQLSVAEKAFFKFSRGGGTVTGPTIKLAAEVARCWTNIDHGVKELHRDDERGMSEMQALAWDLETNVRASNTFLVPHLRDKKGGPERLTDVRDIYEGNANAGARRLREAIWKIIPSYFVEEAQTLCRATLVRGDNRPLRERIDKSVEAFRALGIAPDRLVQRIGTPTAKWTAHDVADLGVIYQSIERGEIRVEDEFPAERVSAAEIAAQAGKRKPTPAAAKADPNVPDADGNYPDVDPVETPGWGPSGA